MSAPSDRRSTPTGGIQSGTAEKQDPLMGLEVTHYLPKHYLAPMR